VCVCVCFRAGQYMDIIYQYCDMSLDIVLDVILLSVLLFADAYFEITSTLLMLIYQHCVYSLYSLYTVVI